MKNQSFCIFGNPVKHSLSPQIHTAFAKQFSLTLSYEKIEPELPLFENAVRDFQQAGGHGANITAPFKQRAYAMCDNVSERARLAKSVNTFIFQDKKIVGDNTDGVGLIRDITHNLHYSLTNKKIILLGAGGATRGIINPLLNENPDSIIIFNRTRDHAKTLSAEFNIDYCDTLLHQSADVVIDCLPFNTGMTLPNDFAFSQDSLFYDLKYHQPMMPNQATIKAAGIGMLIEQAAEAFYRWTGYQPNTHDIVKVIYAI